MKNQVKDQSTTKKESGKKRQFTKTFLIISLVLNAILILGIILLVCWFNNYKTMKDGDLAIINDALKTYCSDEFDDVVRNEFSDEDRALREFICVSNEAAGRAWSCGISLYFKSQNIDFQDGSLVLESTTGNLAPNTTDNSIKEDCLEFIEYLSNNEN